jgi:multidrug efflux pump subunit AcrA (membrane-fusion protein)
MKALVEAAVTSREVPDRTQRDLDQARAHRELAASTAERLTTVISKTRITAPIDGTVVLRSIENGETVTADTPLVTIADLSKTHSSGGR